MKKSIIVVLILAVSFALVSAFAGETDLLSMRVVNCEEWVSLREKPNTASKRIVKVPLDSIVGVLGEAENGFLCCRYENKTGYILSSYLTAEDRQEVTDDELNEAQKDEKIPDSENVPSASRSYRAYLPYSELAAEGEIIYMDDGVRVICLRVYEDEGEQMKTACYAGNDMPLWGYVAYTEYTTELNQTDAFIAGRTDDPCVMVYNADVGLDRINLKTGEVEWTLLREEITLGSGICHYTDSEGRIYIAGFYGPDPVCISLDGKVEWETSVDNTDIYWPYAMRQESDGLHVDYDSGSDSFHYELIFSTEGELISQKLVKRE